MLRIKSVLLAAAAATLMLAPAPRASADTGDAILGAIVGGVITGIAVNEANKNKPPRRRVVVRPVPESPQRAANRLTQTALNYFSFNAGYADGLFGPQTATAVRAYQSFLAFPQTGKLAAMEHDILMGAYNRGQTGDYASVTLVNSSPLGPRALLIEQRDAMLGRVATSTGTTMPVISTSGGEPAVADSDAGTLTGLPLIPVPTGNGNLAEFCGSDAVTGPRVTLAAMSDPAPALDQAFCSARAESIASSAALAGAVEGVSMAEIEAQCDQLGPVMKVHVADLSSMPRAGVIDEVRDFVDGSGADAAQLASTARICLGVGYRKGDMDGAIGSGLLLVALGQPAYGELMGHHLQHGFGVAANQNRALDWLVWSTEELRAGAMPVFGNGDSGRVDLVDEAVYRLNGGAAPALTPGKNAASKGRLPRAETAN